MIAIQEALDKVLFSDRYPPNMHPKSSNSVNVLERELWDNRYDMNLCLEHVEVEVRLGRVNGKRFNSGVNKSIFSKISNGLQSYTNWDKTEFCRSTVLNFDKIDNTIRCISEIKDGETSVRYISKQKVCILDFTSVSTCCDIRMCVSLEIPVTARPRLDDATRRVVRDRISYTLGKWRYDLTTVTDIQGQEEYQVEIELVDPVNEQLTNRNSQRISEDLRVSILDLLRVTDGKLENVPLELVRQKWF